MKTDGSTTPAVGCTPRTEAEREHRRQLGQVRDALKLLVRMSLAGLPDDARVLCVGVGTGDEVRELATHFPGWRVVAVDPDPAALSVCRRDAEEAGITARCEFRQATVEELSPGDELFDGATSLLVSHWMPDLVARGRYFSAIAQRLKPGGVLVNADLAGDLASSQTEALLETWIRTLRYFGLPADRFRSSLGSGLALVDPVDVCRLLEASGLGEPVCFFQALLLHAWSARR